MKSLIFSTAARYLMPLLLLFSIFLLFRGHNEPGGGFVGGLVLAASFALYRFAHGTEAALAALAIEPRALTAIGLLAALGSAMVAMFYGLPFQTGIWTTGEIPILGKIGTPQLFDIGVYLIVGGSTLTILFGLPE